MTASIRGLTRQSDITPRQFGVLMALSSWVRMTPSVLADRISCDRNTLSEMLKRMAGRRLVSKKSNPEDRRSIQIQITAKGEEALLAVIPAAAELQSLMLAPLAQGRSGSFSEVPARDRKGLPRRRRAGRVTLVASAMPSPGCAALAPGAISSTSRFETFSTP